MSERDRRLFDAIVEKLAAIGRESCDSSPTGLRYAAWSESQQAWVSEGPDFDSGEVLDFARLPHEMMRALPPR